MFHVTGAIDEPHAWRQCDTAQYARAFYEEGFNLLRPSVGWMGTYKTVILEFPLIEAIMAAAYRWFGPYEVVARLVALAFFAASAAYLFLIVRILVSTAVGWLATWMYLVLPLGVYYSRAVHIDFAVVFFAHAMAYHMLDWSRSGGAWSLLAATFFGCVGYLIKAPYVFYLALPFGYAARARLRERPWAVIPLFIAPAGCFLLWRRYADQVNTAAPDWEFLPGYFKFIDMGSWYYGPLAMRWNAAAWQMLLSRLVMDVCAIAGLLLVGVGLMTSVRARQTQARLGIDVIWLWCAGTIGYLLIFFNLNVVHDYYQIPFLAPLAVLMALGIDRIGHGLSWGGGRAYAMTVAIALAVVIIASHAIAGHRYYRHDGVRLTAGAMITRATPPGAVVIAAAPDTDPRDPRLLYYARRYGWSIQTGLLTIPIVEALQREGATHLAVLTNLSTALADDVRRLCAERLEQRIGDATLTTCALTRQASTRP